MKPLVIPAWMPLFIEIKPFELDRFYGECDKPPATDAKNRELVNVLKPYFCEYFEVQAIRERLRNAFRLNRYGFGSKTNRDGNGAVFLNIFRFLAVSV